MEVWIEEIKRLIRVFFKNYVIFWGVLGIFLGFSMDSLALFIPLCLCLGYYFEAKYKEKINGGKNR
ncbi:hypothetical protein [uncultured Clostridium sp.]|uniref:hypothetical protein n=1 Tax=uncultured Clostridium sp. TaxID=59620 RepID=UPI002637DA9F|nr:hypothetical protein [uncultured Clostridium sp.]